MKEIYLDESEEKLTVDEIQSFEKKIGKIFPNDFKKFLLKSNGIMSIVILMAILRG